MYRIQATGEVMADIFTPSNNLPFRCLEGLPKSCVLESVAIDRSTGIWELLYYHPDHLEGELVDITVLFQSINPDHLNLES